MLFWITSDCYFTQAIDNISGDSEIGVGELVKLGPALKIKLLIKKVSKTNKNIDLSSTETCGM